MSHLANYVDDAEMGIASLHLYTFNQVKATNAWRESFIKKGRWRLPPPSLLF